MPTPVLAASPTPSSNSHSEGTNTPQPNNHFSEHLLRSLVASTNPLLVRLAWQWPPLPTSIGSLSYFGRMELSCNMHPNNFWVGTSNHHNFFAGCSNKICAGLSNSWGFYVTIKMTLGIWWNGSGVSASRSDWNLWIDKLATSNDKSLLYPEIIEPGISNNIWMFKTRLSPLRGF